MSLSAEDRHHILVNVTIEHERMFTVLGHVCANDPDKTDYLAKIETVLKDCVRTFEETDMEKA